MFKHIVNENDEDNEEIDEDNEEIEKDEECDTEDMGDDNEICEAEKTFFQS
jgi:hypothetical protein